MRKKVTLKQLAQELGLSISTISKSLKNDPEISQATIDRVKKLAKEHNYKPNALAVSLKSSKTRNIGVVIPDIINNFFAKVLLGIENEASKNNYKIITVITNESYEKEVEYLDMLSYNGVDGFILAVAQETQSKGLVEHFNEILKDDIPIVMFDRVSDEVYCDKVVVDDNKAAGNAVNVLLDQGCKNIGVVSTIHKLSVGKERMQGVKEALEEKGMELSYLKLRQNADYDEEIAKFLKSNQLDGVIGADEIAAVCTLNAANKSGLKIPDEVSVIGFTNGMLAKYSYPGLTTVSQHAKRMGKTAAKILIDKLELRADRYLPDTKYINTSIVKRGSTK
ncbi:LacI family DNA-binding transcriptional regulator [Aquimarina agarivorans]|uniref:LacI family DNA-binding transcriptional regulator n=1 Tax=Aquimarina agarivorans TaxID=980584 RepID=UPI000248FB44|nr:LacI family DNA-binding transcriptional regulator [Aquimarina agarivorans]